MIVVDRLKELIGKTVYYVENTHIKSSIVISFDYGSYGIFTTEKATVKLYSGKRIENSQLFEDRQDAVDYAVNLLNS